MKDAGFFKTQIHVSPWQYSLLMAGTFFHPKVENLAVLFQIQLVLLKSLLVLVLVFLHAVF